MAGSIPDDHYVVRYCKPSDFDEGALTAQAFKPRRERGEEYLSVNWLEYFHEPKQSHAVDRVRGALSGKLQLKTRGRLAVLNVRQIKLSVRRIKVGAPDRALHAVVEHQPLEDDPSHAGIGGWGAGNDMVVALALKQIVLDKHLHPAML